MRGKEGYHYFPLKTRCITVRKDIVGETFLLCLRVFLVLKKKDYIYEGQGDYH